MRGVKSLFVGACHTGSDAAGKGASGHVGALLFCDSLEQAWGRFLSQYEWQWFCTFTFRDPPHPEAADKLFRVWTSKLNRSLYPSRYLRNPNAGVFWVRALEWTKREVLHYHALLGDVEDLNARASRLHWKEVWFALAGIARIEKPRGSKFVASYVSKYVAKGGEIDLSPNLRDYAEQISVVPFARLPQR